ncbi:hypothetical protein M9458_013505, partial [Cirrhinus mrigala]
DGQPTVDYVLEYQELAKTYSLGDSVQKAWFLGGLDDQWYSRMPKYLLQLSQSTPAGPSSGSSPITATSRQSSPNMATNPKSTYNMAANPESSPIIVAELQLPPIICHLSIAANLPSSPIMTASHQSSPSMAQHHRIFPCHDYSFRVRIPDNYQPLKHAGYSALKLTDRQTLKTANHPTLKHAGGPAHKYTSRPAIKHTSCPEPAPPERPTELAPAKHLPVSSPPGCPPESTAPPWLP